MYGKSRSQTRRSQLGSRKRNSSREPHPLVVTLLDKTTGHRLSTSGQIHPHLYRDKTNQIRIYAVCPLTFYQSKPLATHASAHPWRAQAAPHRITAHTALTAHIFPHSQRGRENMKFDHLGKTKDLAHTTQQGPGMHRPTRKQNPPREPAHKPPAGGLGACVRTPFPKSSPAGTAELSPGR